MKINLKRWFSKNRCKLELHDYRPKIVPTAEGLTLVAVCRKCGDTGPKAKLS